MDSFTHFASSTGSGPLGEVVGFTGSILALIILTAVLFIFALRGGRTMLISLILSFYVGFAVYTFFPFTDELAKAAGNTKSVAAIASMVLFGILSGMAYFLIRRVAGSGYTSVKTISLFILALLTGGFLLALGYHSFSITDVYPLSSTLKSLFAPDAYFFWWFIAPLAGLFLLAK